MAHNLIIHTEGFTNDTFKWIGSKDFATWYLNRNENGVLFVKDIENLYLKRQMFFFFPEYIFGKPPLYEETRAHLTLVLYVIESSSSELLVSHIWLNKLCKEGRKRHMSKMAGRVGVFDKQS